VQCHNDFDFEQEQPVGEIMNCATEKGELITFASGFLNQGRGFGYRYSSTGKTHQIWRLEQTGNSLRIKAMEIHYHSDSHMDAVREWKSIIGARNDSVTESLNSLLDQARGHY
jgi:hypothetical protein